MYPGTRVPGYPGTRYHDQVPGDTGYPGSATCVSDSLAASSAAQCAATLSDCASATVPVTRNSY
eukprot:827914-Rhodomonas_salina.1